MGQNPKPNPKGESNMTTATKPDRIKHEEYTYQGRPVILDAARIGSQIEIMLMSSDGGREYACEYATDDGAALRTFDRIRATYPPDAEQPAPAPLSGKYAKLRDDLKAVHKIGLEAANGSDDGGTCNFDAPALFLPRWNNTKLEQACKEAGAGCYKWRLFGTIMTVISFPIPGQANKRTTAAEAMTKALQEMGYAAYTYFQAD
ncbi:MAG: hypothetical protein NC311_12550 [Muribaculaceae bacterium]|nr:hypothetical protein [Muribaculaceae bacterium]MCM1439681.1 hypothetical protein [Roseburia sp.]